MANNNTIQRQAQGINKGDLAALALGTSTTETAFSRNALTVQGVSLIAAVPAIISLPDQGAVPIQWDGGKPFIYRAWGTCVTGTSTNLTLKLYQVPASIVAAGTGLTLSNDNVIAASTARAVNTATGKFFFEALLQWDSTSSKLHGQFTTEISNLVDAWAATTSVTTATAFDTELNFILSATLSSGNAANIVNLMEQCLESL